MKQSVRNLILSKVGSVTAPPATEKQEAYYESRRGTTPNVKEKPIVEEPINVQEAPQAPASGSISLTPEMLQQLMTSMASAIVAEFKKPSPEEEAKRAAEKALLDRRRTEMVRIAREETARMEESQARCPHLKENNKPSTGGQLFSDGHVRMICLRCGKITEDYVPSAMDMANGFGNVSDEFRGTGSEQPFVQ